MGLIDLLAPNLCIICHKPCFLLPEFPGFCRGCLQDLPWRFKRAKLDWSDIPDGQILNQMTKPVKGFSQNQRGRFLHVYIACDYRFPISQQLLRLKFHGCTGLSEPLAALGYQAVRLDQSDFDAVIAVPLHSRRLQERGYNQARLIAMQIAARMNCPDLSDFLIRHRPTGRQSEQINRAVRIANLNNAFSLNFNLPGLPAPDRVLASRKILLVDDVMTTGATLRSAALPLIMTGAEVSALVIASDLQGDVH
jgi:ComF family protein